MSKLPPMAGDGQVRPARGAPTISYGGEAREPTRRILLLTKLKRTSMRMGAVTQSFFTKGDELAATEFENLPHDDPMLVPPKLGFRSFDRIPRHRGRVAFVLVLIAAATLIVLDR
ncbi:MAG TPA: hypothetical protein VMT03_09540, partial [Polyangia bacterium]|nr:hypothetical protein [Polyangia bacterium]